MNAVAPLAGSLLSVFVAASSLALPWLAVGEARARSSIDLIGSVNALEVASGPVMALVLGAWLVVPLVAAGALVLGAAGRTTGAAVAVLVVSLLVESAIVAIASTEVISLAWGGVIGGVAAGFGAVLAVVSIVVSRRSATRI
ncbi:MAG: hypothetical protein AAGD35_04145 [Actinomycetota bacterium]